MDTPVKCTKSIAFGEKSNPSCGPTKHRKDTFHKKRVIWFQKGFNKLINMKLQLT